MCKIDTQRLGTLQYSVGSKVVAEYLRTHITESSLHFGFCISSKRSNPIMFWPHNTLSHRMLFGYTSQINHWSINYCVTTPRYHDQCLRVINQVKRGNLIARNQKPDSIMKDRELSEISEKNIRLIQMFHTQSILAFLLQACILRVWSLYRPSVRKPTIPV